MELKIELDTKKSTKAAVAIVTVHELSRISLATDSPQLAATNALVTIVIIAILYYQHLAPPNHPSNLPCALMPSLSSSRRHLMFSLPPRANQLTMIYLPSERSCCPS